MKKITLLGLLIFFQFAFSQVTMEKNKLMRDGQTYKISQYSEVFKNDNALAAFKKSRTNNTVGKIFVYAGGVLIVKGVASMIFRKQKLVQVGYTQDGPVYGLTRPDEVWPNLLGGIAFAGIGIPSVIAAKKNAKKAIAIENGEATAFQPYFKLESAGNGLALSYHF